MTDKAYSCRHCHKPFRVLDQHAGRNVGCPRCHKPNAIPIDFFAEELSNDIRWEAGDVPETSEAEPKQRPPSSHGEHHHDSPSQASAVDELAGALQRSRPASQRPAPDPSTGFLRPQLARVSYSIGRALLALATIVQIYIFIDAEWRDISSLPVRVAIPVMALLFVPAGSIALGGVMFMIYGRALDYLYRITSAVEATKT